MALDRVVFPTVPQSRVVKLYRAVERFHTHHHMLAWVCWLIAATIGMTIGAMVEPSIVSAS